MARTEAQIAREKSEAENMLIKEKKKTEAKKKKKAKAAAILARLDKGAEIERE